MNSAERIRAYLDTRAAFRKEEDLQRRPHPGHVIDEQFDYSTRKYVQLTEADLEVILQMMDLLARVASHSWSGGAVTPDDIQKLIERQVTGQ